MLRMVLLGLLIPLGVGVLAAMELKTPPRTAVAVVQPVAEITFGMNDSNEALAKADRLESTYAKTETPTPPALVEQRISVPEAATIGSPDAPRIISRHWHEPKARKLTTAALPKAVTPKVTSKVTSKSKPTAPDIKRAANPDRSRAAGDIEACRLSAFGGLRKALNLPGCEI